MNATVEYNLFLICKKLWSFCPSNESCEVYADRVSAPLVYWVTTGRCSGHVCHVLAHLTKRQIATIANRLYKVNPDGMAEYDKVIAFIREYLDKF